MVCDERKNQQMHTGVCDGMVCIIFYRAMHFSAFARSWDRMSSVCL